MKVLIACEFSGIVRDAFNAKGHDAYSCDLLETEKNGHHIVGDVLDYLDWRDTVAQEQLLKEGQAQTGLPAIHNFQEKKLLKMLLELRDQENLATYTYLEAEMTGKLTYVGRSVGYGIPYATEYTNPQKWIGQGCVIAQADPNGLFMPGEAEGTWVMMVAPNGDVKPVYFEPRVVVSPFKLTTD